MAKRNQHIANNKFTQKMNHKLAVLLGLILVAFGVLSARLYVINRDDGENYKRKVLSQRAYDSITIPAKRGEIVDRNNTKIAVSQKVYNVVIDSMKLNADEGENLEPTLRALYEAPLDFTITKDELRAYINANPSSQYKIIAKKQNYDSVSKLMTMINNPSDYPQFRGVWLEDSFQREYPYKSLACDVIGFVSGNNEGMNGLESYYNDLLVGTNGREYGYLNSDENLERTLKPAQDGKTLITSLDVNIQSIVEKHILAFNEEHRDEARPGYGSSNTGVIIMNPSNGEILAMASYPVYDLNDPWNMDDLDVDIKLNPEDFGMSYDMFSQNSDGTESTAEEREHLFEEYILSHPTSIVGGMALTSNGAIDISFEQNDMGIDNAEPVEDIEDIDATASIDINLNSDEQAEEESKEENKIKYAGMTYDEAYKKAIEDAKLAKLNSIWKNFCISSTYEPGSTMKPFTMATGLEEGIFSGEESYVCNGVLTVGEHDIHCNNRLGHGALTFSGALEQSCNVAFMKMGSTIGKKTFMKYNQLFNFGLKTNVDITGEALTNNLVFDINTMTPTDLAISSFGQGFNVTMIQMASGFCSLINGGYYYQPHFVTRIQDSSGATVQTVEPRIIKQTISETTSDKIKQLCINVVEEGTGKSARPAGYRIGGKTGTAEKYPRGTGNYVVSFLSFAPAENPALVCYVVIDEPNVAQQASAKYAAVLCKDILTEVLPYMNIFQTEELSEKEAAELAEKQQEFSQGSTGQETEENVGEIVIDIDGANENLTGGSEEDGVVKHDSSDTIVFVDEEEATNEIKYDKETGYAIDPTTGILLDPETGQPVDQTISDL